MSHTSKINKKVNYYFISMVMLSQLNLKDCGFLKIKANYQGSWVYIGLVKSRNIALDLLFLN